MEISIYSMSNSIANIPNADIMSLRVILNEYGEMLITAKDSNGNDISRSGGLPMPPCPFILAYSAANKDWITIPLQEFPTKYGMVTCIVGAS